MRKLFFILATFVLVMLYGSDVNAGYDVTAPKLNGVTLDKTKVTKPGVLNITLDIIEEETGVVSIGVYCEAQRGGNDQCLFHGNVPNTFTGKYTVSAPISSKFDVADNYYISYVVLEDAQGNRNCYSRYEDNNRLYLMNSLASSDKSEYCCFDHSFAVEEEFDVDFQYYITNPNVVSKIEDMGNDEIGMITYDDRNPVAGKEIFAAIKGTNKTIVFSNDSAQWVFKGNDITDNIKDVDLRIDASQVSGEEYGSTNNILKIDFADNGELPGEARIRLKSDYMYKLHKLSSTLLLYYLDEDSNSVEKIHTDVDYILDDSDHWCQFYVSHNSSYVISTKAIRYSPKLYAIINDKKSNAQYRITKTGKNGTVEYQKSLKRKAKTITIPATIKIDGISYKVTDIAVKAFKNNKVVTKIVVGKNVKTIGNHAFSGCSKLKTVSLGASVKVLRSKAFYRCTSLARITIPAKVTTIGDWTFYGCKKLKTITIKSANLRNVGVYLFSGINSKAKIKVPSAKLGKYKMMLKNQGQRSTVKIIK